MSFSYELVNKLKIKLDIKTDTEVCQVMPKTSSGNMSQVKNGKRHLTEEQALYIAETCKIDPVLVLINLAKETAKTEKAKRIWSEFAKRFSVD